VSLNAEATYSVSQLCAEVQELLQEVYSSLWVAGEIQGLKEHRRGHVYFDLIEKGPADEIVGKVAAVCWRKDHERIRRALEAAGQALAEGQEIRCRGNLDFYAPFGRLQLAVREVDPVFTLGQLARRRRETLAALAAAGLLERNRALPLPALPLRVALVTSEGSAAYHDFLATLRESGYGFEVVVLHASVQGRAAEVELAAAFAALTRIEVDCVALVRGGGARADLAAFDARPVAEAVARSPVPVLTGLGHEIDETIADRVAHTALKTPTKVAELLVERMRAAEAAVAASRQRLLRAAPAPLRRAAEATARVERGLRAASFRLEGRRERLADLARRLSRSSRRLIASRGALVEGRERLCRGLGVERTLARGFTITRDAAGRILKSAGAVQAGDRIVSDWRDGSRTSRVEEG
jgi:exodeoxyribonuclease VII large subunit